MKKRLIILAIFLFAGTALAQKMTVKDGDANVLMEVNDEGIVGSITLPSGAAPSTTTNKLYNVSGSLYWNGSALGLAGSAGGWTDGGTVVYLTTSTDKVGIGDSSPTYTLDVAGMIGINDTQVLKLPDQTDFTGTLILGDGGGSLSHTGGNDGRYNTGVGVGALNGISTGASNTAVGSGALYTNTAGNTNTAIGYHALRYNTTGDGNTASGIRALEDNTTGYINTATGSYALGSNTTGYHNIGIGHAANYYNQEGSSNVVIGFEAGYGTSAHNKSNNVMIGRQAGHNSDQDNNIFIGYQAGYNETGSNKLYIENSSSSSPLIGGDFSTDELYFNGKVGIGDTSLTHTLDVAGKIGINDTQILFLPDQTDFVGTLYLGDGGGSLSHSGDPQGRYNTAVGIKALNANTTGNKNTASGFRALCTNTTGNFNTASGYYALEDNTAGIINTATGSYALGSNTLGNYNIGIGHAANYYNQEGSSNVIIGYEAGYGSSTHNKAANVIIGMQAGYNADQDDNNNIFIGYQAGYNETGSNKLYIENSNSPSPLIGGDFSADELYFNGHVGIGTTGPQNTLDVEGGMVVGASYSGTETAPSNGLLVQGNVGIGTNGPQNTLDVEGGMVVGASYSGTETAPSNGLLVQGNVGIGDASATYTLDVAGKVGIDGTQVLYLPGGDFYGTLYLGDGGGSLSHTFDPDGQYNTAIGMDALNNNTTGSYNTAIGKSALFSNDTGYRNTASGFGALSDNTSGYSNTASGYYTLNHNTTGYLNTAFGQNALATNTTGDSNTAIGYLADVSTGDLTNATAIGNGAIVDASNKVRIGNTSVTVIEGKVDFTFPSDSTKKENFLKVDGEHVLNEIRNFNLYSWNYKGDDPAKFRHYGPMGQEFFSAFGQDEMGTIGSDTTLCGSDVAGINMIGVQALEKRTSKLKAKTEEWDDMKICIDKLLNVVREQSEELHVLRATLASLHDMQSRMVKLEATVQEFQDE